MSNATTWPLMVAGNATLVTFEVSDSVSSFGPAT